MSNRRTVAQSTPILDALMSEGIIYVDELDQLVGIASDDEHVLMGHTDYRPLCEAYLTDFPTPASW